MILKLDNLSYRIIKHMKKEEKGDSRGVAFCPQVPTEEGRIPTHSWSSRLYFVFFSWTKI